MIRVVLFDLGLTLVDAQNRPLPHVAPALRTIAGFRTADGKPLASALVSDFTMATPPVTAAKVKALFDDYLAILDGADLRSHFEPVARRVTLSTQAGVMKPDRKIFETALRRLRVKASLAECLFITENAGHIRTARRDHHMATLQYGKSFADWLQAPAMIAHLVDPASSDNAHAALRNFLDVAHGLEVSDATPGRGRSVDVHGTLWRPVGAGAGRAHADVHAPFPVDATVTRGIDGRIRDVRLAPPSREETAAAAAFVRSLARHGQTTGTSRSPADATTHAIETDAEGRRKLVRRRFRAV